MRTGDFCLESSVPSGWVPEGVALIVSCEHASAYVPRRVAPCFAEAPARRALRDHRGFDLGAAWAARQLARAAGVACLEGTVSRLVVDLNRSPHHRQLFSQHSRALAEEEKRWVLQTYYWPHRERVVERVEAARRAGALAVHVAVHSFTPELHGVVRHADVGLLYDPARPIERRLVLPLQHCVSSMCRLRVRRNYPYRGVADGLPAMLRRLFADASYAGLELELNQALLAPRPRALVRRLIECLRRGLWQLRAKPEPCGDAGAAHSG